MEQPGFPIPPRGGKASPTGRVWEGFAPQKKICFHLVSVRRIRMGFWHLLYRVGVVV